MSSSSTGTCWPTETQERLLEACFLPGDRANQALAEWRQGRGLETLDPASAKFLPLLFRRHGERGLDPELYQKAYLACSSTWQRNQRRLLAALALIRDLKGEGISCLLLKGVALTLAHYRDAGVRPMDDVDILVHRADLLRAASVLERAGWRAEGRTGTADIVRRSRVLHAWQFSRGEDESADLHWHPVLRCFSPEVGELFWTNAQTVQLFGKPVGVPCAADLLFHACAHGLQWSWTPQIRWIPDALTVMASPASPVDWQRVALLAEKAEMNVRLHRALDYLRKTFDAPVPEALLGRLATAGDQPRESREYELLQRPCPLGVLDRARWHIGNFRRIRKFDLEWRDGLAGVSFLQYLALFPKFSQP
jgi:hypothetical protein